MADLDFCVINDENEIIAMSTDNGFVLKDGYKAFYEAEIGPFQIIDNGDGIPRLKVAT